MVEGPSLHPDPARSRAVAAARPGGGRAVFDVHRGERVCSGAQQFLGVQVVEQQQGWLDADADLAAGEVQALLRC